MFFAEDRLLKGLAPDFAMAVNYFIPLECFFHRINIFHSSLIYQQWKHWKHYLHMHNINSQFDWLIEIMIGVHDAILPHCSCFIRSPTTHNGSISGIGDVGGPHAIPCSLQLCVGVLKIGETFVHFVIYWHLCSYQVECIYNLINKGERW